MRKAVYFAIGGVIAVIVIALVVVLVVVLSGSKDALPPPCDSEIYCHGELLHYAAMLLPSDRDSKSIVDSAMLNDEKTIIDNLNLLLEKTDSQPTLEEFEEFLYDNFDREVDLDSWTPPDFNEEPSFLDRITSEEVKLFATAVVNEWISLGRKIKPEVQINSEKYSLIYVSHGFIIPGGRFQEYYYWDSYWIVEGLLVTEMYDTARGMIENFLEIVKNVGHVPNGGRVYYIRRSQPPLLSFMAKLYYEHTDDIAWLREHIETLETEVQFWVENRVIEIIVGGETYYAGIYNAPTSGPRPESYREDLATAVIAKNNDEKQKIYIELKSAAESGWDFSTRWIIGEDGSNKGNISYTHITSLIPVDLNSFLYGAFNNIASFYKILNNSDKEAHWSDKARQINKTINEVLWNKEDGIWYDYDFILNQPRKYFAASNLSPLWTKAYNTDMENVQTLIDSVIAYLEREEIVNYPGGIPATTEHSGEQWDFPNVWPCLQSIIVEGLEETDTDAGKYWAKIFAERFVNATMIRFNIDGSLYEKYDAQEPGMYGGGGEYENQIGFGWTNGVILKFINTYYTTVNTNNRILITQSLRK